MNIAYVVPEFVTETQGGGLASYIYQITGILADLGHKITIIVKSEVNEDTVYNKNIRLIRVYVDLQNVDMNIPGSIYREWSHVLNKKLLEVHQNGGDFDVVHYANWNALAYERTSIPSVVRISSDLPLWRASNRLDFDINKKYECIKVTDYLEDLALMKADIVFGPSHLLADVISERTGKKIHVIESPFDDKRGERDDSLYKEKLSGKRYILYHSQLKLSKGIKLIGDSIYEILKRNPDIYFVFAGSELKWESKSGDLISPKQYIIDHAGEFKERLFFFETLSRARLYPILEHCECCVLPSRIDNLPNAAIEAMSFGKIVIGTTDSSFEQLIEHCKNGFLIERENAEELVFIVQKVLELSDRKKVEISNAAKRRIKQINSNKIAEQVLQLYEKAIYMPEQEYNKEYYEKINSLLPERNDIGI